MKPTLAAILWVTLLAAPGCANPGGGRLSYAQVQAINPGVSASWVAQEFPFGSVARRADGTIESISYRVQDPRGQAQNLQLRFDGQEILRDKAYSGRVERPGGPQGGPQTR